MRRPVVVATALGTSAVVLAVVVDARPAPLADPGPEPARASAGTAAVPPPLDPPVGAPPSPPAAAVARPPARPAGPPAVRRRNRITSDPRLASVYRPADESLRAAAGAYARADFASAAAHQAAAADRLAGLDGDDHPRVRAARFALRTIELEGGLDPVRRAAYVGCRTAALAANPAVPVADPAAAIPPTRAFLAPARETFGERHADVVRGHRLLAGLYLRADRGGDAVRELDVARDLVGREVGTASADHAAVLVDLADAQTACGRPWVAKRLYADAVEALERVLGDCLESEEPAAAAALARGLEKAARLAAALGEFPGAFQRQAAAYGLLAAYAAGRDRGREYARGVADLAQYEIEIGRLEEAGDHLRAADDVLAAFGGEGAPEYPVVLGARAALAARAGRRAEAAGLYGRLVDLCRRATPADPVRLATALGNQAVLHAALGDGPAALPLIEESYRIRVARQGDGHPAVVAAAADYAAALLLTGRPAEAERLCRSWLLGTRPRLDDTAAVQTRTERRAAVDRFRHALDLYLSAAAAGTPAGVVYDAVAAWKGADAAAAARDVADFDDPATRAAARDLAAVQRRLLRAAADPVPPGRDEDGRRAFTALAVEFNRLEYRLATARARFRPTLGMPRPSSESVSAVLRPGSAFVDYVTYNPPPPPPAAARPAAGRRLVAFVHRRGAAAAMVDLGEEAAVGVLVRDYHRGLDRQTHADVDRLGAALYARVWAPLVPLLAGATRVIVAPDGAVGRVSFAALPVPVPGSGSGYLVERVAVGYAHSAYDLLAALTPDPAGLRGDGLLTVGPLDYGTRRPGHDLGPLPGAAVELEAVRDRFRAQFKGERVVEWPGSGPGGGIDREFLDAGLGASAPQGGGRFRYQFWSTHGFYREPPIAAALRDTPPRGTAPWSSPAVRQLRVVGVCPRAGFGLSLSRANEDPGGGEVTAQELQGFDLRGCGLVYLSACHTAAEMWVGGEGPVGLVQAVRTAGARAAAAALRRQDDAAASLLADRYCAGLWHDDGGEPQFGKLIALQAAQVYLLNHPAELADRARRLGPAAGGRGPGGIAPAGGPGPSGPGRPPPYFWGPVVQYGDSD